MVAGMVLYGIAYAFFPGYRYGYSWIAETVFSSIKRTFGEYVTARKFAHMGGERCS
jgi:hypothetical protein